jgi:hypothetical protein
MSKRNAGCVAVVARQRYSSSGDAGVSVEAWRRSREIVGAVNTGIELRTFTGENCTLG